MIIRKNSLVLAAAFTGLLGGTMGRLNAAPFNPNPQDVQSDTAKAQEKHSCVRTLHPPRWPHGNAA